MAQQTIITTKHDAYAALQHAAEQIGRTTYERQITAHRKAGRSPNTFRFSPTPTHLAIVEMMPAVLNESVSIEDAYGFLLSPDVMTDRFA